MSRSDVRLNYDGIIVPKQFVESYMIPLIGLIRLTEVPNNSKKYSPLYSNPVIANFTEVTGSDPIVGQFRVNYTTGYVKFNPSDAGRTIIITYYGIGTPFLDEDINLIRKNPIYINPAPTIISVSPGTGAQAGGDTITVTGTNFVNDMTGTSVVYFNGTALTTTFGSSISLTAVTPAYSGIRIVNVLVVNPDGQYCSLSNSFTYSLGPSPQFMEDFAKYPSEISPSELYTGVMPNIIYEDGIFKSWYSNNTLYGIYYATSVDGLSWTPYVNNPLSMPGSFGGLYCPNVIKIDSTYYMFASDLGVGGSKNLYRWHSSDGITWIADYNGNAVITYQDVSASGWTVHAIANTSVVYEVGTTYPWKLLFEALTPASGFETGYAYSVDGLSWNYYGSNPVLSSVPDTWHAIGAGNPEIHKLGNTYYCIYGGVNSINNLWCVGWAYSADLINWTDGANSPIVQSVTQHVADASLAIPIDFAGKTYKNYLFWDYDTLGTMGVSTLKFINMSDYFEFYKTHTSVMPVTPSICQTIGGIEITVSGLNFADGATVYLDNVAQATTFVDSNTLTATVVAHSAGLVDLKVVNPDYQSCILSGWFTYTPVLAPEFSLLNPVVPKYATTYVGGTITINGSNFVDGAIVYFNTVAQPTIFLPLETTFVSSSQLTAVYSGMASGAIDVKIVNPDTQFCLKTGAFIINNAVELYGISPSTGVVTGGTPVTANGNYFLDGAILTFDTTDVSTVLSDSSHLTAISPSHALGAVNIKVTNPDTTSSTLTNEYTYTAAPPLSRNKSYTLSTQPYWWSGGYTLLTNGDYTPDFDHWYEFWYTDVSEDMIVDLVSSKSLSNVRFLNAIHHRAGMHAPTALTVSGSLNNSDWTPLGTFSLANGDWTDTYAYDPAMSWSNNLTVSGSYRYIKFSFTLPGGGTSFKQIEVY